MATISPSNINLITYTIPINVRPVDKMDFFPMAADQSDLLCHEYKAQEPP